MKDKILKLKQEGFSHNEISEILSISKSTVSYYTNPVTNNKSKKRGKDFRESNRLKRKLYSFCERRKNTVRNYTSKSSIRNRLKHFVQDHKKDTDMKFNYKLAIKKLKDNPYCYLTGQQIDLENNEEYQLDHIVPVSKGGENTIENLGLLKREINQMKTDMTVDELIENCKKILEYNGYVVTQT